MGKRIAIVGTAPSWRDCPFDDPSLHIACLNDAYTLGIPRVDSWWDLHPLDHFYYRDPAKRVVDAAEVPPGYYVRPIGHLDKLKEMARTIPVFLQSEPPADWGPNAQRLPIESYVEKYGDYWTSGPAYMVAWAIEQGAEEIQVWGIHLETEQEYRDQRANFEHLLGIAKGRGIKVVMAPASPVLRHGWRYAYQPRPAMHPAKAKLLEVRHRKGELMAHLANMGRWSKRAHLADQVVRLKALEWDCLRALQQRAPVVIQAPVVEGIHGAQ